MNLSCSECCCPALVAKGAGQQHSEHPKVRLEQLLGCLLKQAPLVLAERVLQPLLHCSYPFVSLRQNFGNVQASNFAFAQHVGSVTVGYFIPVLLEYTV